MKVRHSSIKIVSKYKLTDINLFSSSFSEVYFIQFCKILALKLVCKEITNVDLNDKTIASLQPNVSPGVII